jgi:transglutaminase-like putative cysteine protease
MTSPYLEASEYIDWQHPQVLAKAQELGADDADASATARRCFEFVRDRIPHSLDHQLNPVTCQASEVLIHGTGYCCAKSHLLAALLRANGIPAGLCYQRLSRHGNGAPYCLHGLNALQLPEFGWYRVDARGNKPGVQAEFMPPIERLAFPISDPGEADLREIWPEPLPSVVKVLRGCRTWDQAWGRWPDVELIPMVRVDAHPCKSA